MKDLLDLYSQTELNELLKKYDLEYIREYSKPQEVTVGSIKRELEGDHETYVDSPDGYVRVSDFVYKGAFDEYQVKFDKTVLRVSEGHRFQTTLGWEHVRDLYSRYISGGDVHILHKSGKYIPVEIIKNKKEIPIVDIIIDHENHRYYSDDLVSHNTNVGKSAMMCFLAGELMKAGHNVLYISMEMSEDLVHERVDANLLDIKTDDLKHTSKEEFINKIKKVKSKTHGKLYVKEYPTSSAHAGHFRHLIKELKQKKKFVPDVVFIDYINICASSRYKSLSGVNSYSYIKAIAEEIRGLAVEFDLAIMTATQTNRGGANDGTPDMTATSESIALPATLDWFCAITTDEVLQENNQQMLHLLKTRWGRKSDIKPQLVGIDWDKMRYTNVGSASELAGKVGNKKPEKKEKKVSEIDWG